MLAGSGQGIERSGSGANIDASVESSAAGVPIFAQSIRSTPSSRSGASRSIDSRIAAPAMTAAGRLFRTIAASRSPPPPDRGGCAVTAMHPARRQARNATTYSRPFRSGIRTGRPAKPRDASRPASFSTSNNNEPRRSTRSGRSSRPSRVTEIASDATASRKSDSEMVPGGVVMVASYKNNALVPIEARGRFIRLSASTAPQACRLRRMPAAPAASPRRPMAPGAGMAPATIPVSASVS